MFNKVTIAASIALLASVCFQFPAKAEENDAIAQIANQKLAEMGISPKKLYIETNTNNPDQGQITGYTVWAYLPSGGSLVIDLDSHGNEWQRYTRGEAKIAGIPPY